MLRLRPFRKNDAKTIITWTSEEKEFYKWSAGILGEYPVSEKRLLEATSGREDNDRYFPFTAFDESGIVGFFTARVRPEDDDKKIRFGYVIVNSSKRGMGYGKKMLMLGLKFVVAVFRIPYMKISAGLNISKYIKNVILPLIPLCIATSCICLLFVYKFDFKYRFFLSSICSVGFGIIALWFFTLTKTERNYIKYLINSKMK